MSSGVFSAIEEAVAARSALLATPDTDAWRLFNGAADGIDGLVIEKYADVLIVQCHEGRLAVDETDLRRAVETLCARLGASAAYRKWFVRDRARLSGQAEREHADARPWIGSPAGDELAVRENGLRFLVRPYDGFSVGLFLEQRDNRRRVRELAAGRRVLNTFAYTCGFSVAAAAGGAISTASVDVHRRYLEWGKRNFAENGLDLSAQRFFLSDTFEFFERAGRQGRRFDLIILDPPSFARLRRPDRVFVLERRLEDLVAGARRLLEPEGLILLSTNHRQIDRERLDGALRASAGPAHPGWIEFLPLPADFAGDPDYSKTLLARYP